MTLRPARKKTANMVVAIGNAVTIHAILASGQSP